MNSKELRKLSRKEILEILLEQTKRIEELENELEKAKSELSERKVATKNIGSLAEASLVLSDIFKAADEAANIYIENVKELAKKEEKNLRKELRELKKKKIEAIEKECEKRILKDDNKANNKSVKKNSKSTNNSSKKKVKEEKLDE